MKKTAIESLKRYGLLAIALVALALQLFCPPAREYLRFSSVVCMLLAIFYGRSLLRYEDTRGWFVQHAAVLAHAAVLVTNGVMGQ